ncbi:MAG: hydroxyacylglutathione hydrolase [Myxococcota bacterium]
MRVLPMPPIDHVVTQIPEAFRSADGRLEVHTVLSWKDNLVWLVVCTETGAAAVVDGPEASGTLAVLGETGAELRTVLNTHTHPDHVGINKDLAKRGKLEGLEVIGPARRAKDVPGLTRGVDDGDAVRIGNVEGRVILTEGHIDGHVSFVFGDLAFCGDTMFAAGCGYLFDGPPAKMHASLQTLAALDPATRVLCAHEYTQDNLRFAWSVEPDNEALAERIRDVWAVRAKGGCTVPSTVGLERATNPFVRTGSATLRAALVAAFPERELGDDAAVFAATRALKDRKDYKSRGDDVLPLA